MDKPLRFSMRFSGQEVFDQESDAEVLLAAAAPDDHDARARLHAILAAACLFTSPQKANAAALKSAVAAEKAGSDVARAWALLAACIVNVAPHALAERRAKSLEILRIARVSSESEFVPIAYFLYLGSLAEDGNVAELDLALSPTGEFFSSFPWLQDQPHVAWFQCLRATMNGLPELAEQIAGEAYLVAQEHGDPDAQTVWIGQLAIVRWMQGRVVELEPAFLHARQMAPHEPVWAVSLAWMWLQQGRRSAARALIVTLPRPSALPLDRNWLATASILAVVAAELGEREIAAEVHEALRPFEDRMVMIGLGVTCWGIVSRPLALTALLLGDRPAAIGHFRKAIAFAARIGAHPWLAEAQTELAETLAASGDPDEIDEALELAREAAATGRALQLHAAEEAASTLLTALSGHGDSPQEHGAAEVSAKPSVRVMGTFEVRPAGGEPARWQSRKARKLLKILVAKRGVAISREAVMHLLWPDESPQQLAGRFSVAASTVRRAFDPTGELPHDSYLEIRHALVRLRIENIDSDVEQFLAASQLALSPAESGQLVIDDVRAALALFQGEALIDEPDDLWAEELRREVHIAFFALSHALAELSSDVGDELTRLECYRGILMADAHDQRAHEGLIDALTNLGARTQAARAREEYAHRKRELGVL